MAGKIAGAVLALIAVAAVVVALSGGGGEKPPPLYTLAEVTPDLTDADPRLKEIVAQANQVLPGGRPAFDRRIRELRGIPVVVNKWGSWCKPCRDEFPLFQMAAKKYGDRVAFLGDNVNDPKDDSRAFLKKRPVPYPSYDDPRLTIGQQFPLAGGAPSTGFFDVRGKHVHTKIGVYHSLADLERDIQRYAKPNSGK